MQLITKSEYIGTELRMNFVPKHLFMITMRFLQCSAVFCKQLIRQRYSYLIYCLKFVFYGISRPDVVFFLLRIVNSGIELLSKKPYSNTIFFTHDVLKWKKN